MHLFLKLIVACVLCGIYVSEDNDSNVYLMITRLVWTTWTPMSAVPKTHNPTPTPPSEPHPTTRTPTPTPDVLHAISNNHAESADTVVLNGWFHYKWLYGYRRENKTSFDSFRGRSSYHYSLDAILLTQLDLNPSVDR